MNLVYLGAGGFIGAILRYFLGELVPHSHGFPLHTLLINWTGCLFLGWLFTLDLSNSKVASAIRLFFGTGLTGAFTTFSTFSVETVALFKQHEAGTAMLYILLSAMGGLLLTALGSKLALIGRAENKETAA